MNKIEPINILLVEDNNADIRLLKDLIKQGKLYFNLDVVMDGEEATLYLRKESKYENVELPDLILLDLYIPKKSGHELLADIKKDNILKNIPVIVMTVSTIEDDILKSYNLHADAYIVKPIKFDQFISAIMSIENFWLAIIKSY